MEIRQNKNINKTRYNCLNFYVLLFLYELFFDTIVPNHMMVFLKGGGGLFRISDCGLEDVCVCGEGGSGSGVLWMEQQGRAITFDETLMVH